MLNFISRHFLKLSLVFYAFGMAQGLWLAVGDQDPAGLLSWKLTQFYVNYIDFGFVKRGMVGTLLYPVIGQTGDRADLAALVIVTFDFIVVAALLLLLRRTMNRFVAVDSELMAVIKAVIVVSPVGVMQLSYDTGRLDHLNFLLAGYALVLLLQGRPVPAGIVVAIGVFVHEAMLLFGFPVLVAACLAMTGRAGSLSERFGPAAVFASLPVLAAVLVVFAGSPGVDFAAVLPPVAMQGVGAWDRSFFQPSLGLSIQQYLVLLFYLAMPYLLLKQFYRANRLGVDPIFIFSLAPLTLFALGIDYARWTHLAFVSVLLAIFFHVAHGKAELSFAKSEPLKLGFFIYLLPLGPIGIARALPYVEAILLALQGKPVA